MNDQEVLRWIKFLSDQGYSQEDIAKILDNIEAQRSKIPEFKPKQSYVKRAPDPWVKQYTISAKEKEKQDKQQKAVEDTKRSIVRDLAIGMGTNDPAGQEAIAAFNAQHVYTPLAAVEWGFPVQTLLGIGGGHLLGNLSGEYYGERGAQLGGLVGGFIGSLGKGPTMKRILDVPMQFTYDPNKAAHFYVNVSPGSYHTIGRESKRMQVRRWVKDLFKGKDADTSTTKWDQDAFAEDIVGQYGILPLALIKDARRNAHKLYNGLPQDMPVFIKNADGTYSLNLKWWEHRMRTDDYTKTLEILYRQKGIDFSKYVERVKRGEIPILAGRRADYMSTVGGNLEDLKTYHLGSQYEGLGGREFSIEELIDTFDAHPFRRSGLFNAGDPQHPYGDQITERVQHHINDLGDRAERYLNNTRLEYLEPDFDIEGLTNQEIYSRRPVSEKLKIKLLDPILYKAQLLADKVKHLTPEQVEKLIPGLHSLNEWGKNFEVGQITGSTPWVQRTRVPITKLITPVLDAEGNPSLAVKLYYGFKSNPEQILPQKVLDYQHYGILPGNVNYKSNLTILKNLKTTKGNETGK